MKVTALIPDDLVRSVEKLSKGENLTKSLVIALSEWVSLKKLSDLSKEVKKKPLKFSKSFSASKVRSLNRKR